MYYLNTINSGVNHHHTAALTRKLAPRFAWTCRRCRDSEVNGKVTSVRAWIWSSSVRSVQSRCEVVGSCRCNRGCEANDWATSGHAWRWSSLARSVRSRFATTVNREGNMPFVWCFTVQRVCRASIWTTWNEDVFSGSIDFLAALFRTYIYIHLRSSRDWLLTWFACLFIHV